MTGGPVIRRVASRVVYRNRWMTVREDRIVRPDRSEGIYGFLEKPDFAVVIPAERDGFHLVEEYRYPIAARTWSFPQGSFPDGRAVDPEELGRAELVQETGLVPRTMTRLGYLHGAHGTSDQGFTVFLATDLTPGEPAREPEEQDMVHQFVSRAEFRGMVRAGVVTDSSTLAAYGLLLMHEQG